MASKKRKAHHKSRLGCKNCKARKIKCDEKRPSCSNCVRRRIDCDFLQVKPIQPGGSPAAALNMMDLELLHCYTTTTYLTLSENPLIREFYRSTVVQLGLHCDYIMRAILAVSGLHLAHHRQLQRDHYLAAAVAHHHAASQVAIPLLNNPTPKDAEMLFLFSVLTTYYALGWPRTSSADTLLLSMTSPNAGFPDWVYMLRGTKGLIELSGVPSSGPLAPLFAHSQSRFILREESCESLANREASAALTALTQLEEVMLLRRSLSHPPHARAAGGGGGGEGGDDTDTDMDDDSERLRQVYGVAVRELKKSFRQADTCRARGETYELIDAFIWVFFMAEDLLPLLRAPTTRREAVAIFAFFCVLLHRLDGHWWMQGWGRHLVAHAYDLLDEEGRLWIRWAVDEIGWVPPPAAERL